MGWSNQGAGQPAADNGASASLFCDSVGLTVVIGPVGAWRKSKLERGVVAVRGGGCGMRVVGGSQAVHD